jgi:hypothetical protein
MATNPCPGRRPEARSRQEPARMILNVTESRRGIKTRQTEKNIGSQTNPGSENPRKAKALAEDEFKESAI